MNTLFGLFRKPNVPSPTEERRSDRTEEVNQGFIHASPERPAKRADSKKTPPRFAGNSNTVTDCLVEPTHGAVQAVSGNLCSLQGIENEQAQQTQMSGNVSAVAMKLRSLQVVENERGQKMDGLCFPSGFPLGPFPTRDMLFSECHNWAADPNVCGGAFGLMKSTFRNGTSRKGPSGNFHCNCRGKVRPSKSDADVSRANHVTLKSDCPFTLTFEQTKEGWVITGCSKPHLEVAREKSVHCGSAMIHNHPLINTRSGMNINPMLRSIPPALNEKANTLHKAGLGPARIYHCLVDECRSEQMEISFTQADIKNKFASSKETLALDCTNLMENLTARHDKDSDLGFTIGHDPEGRLDRIFFLLQNWRNLWMNGGGKVVLYDTKHGTNRYGMKLGCFSLIDGTGMTRVIAASFLLCETAEMFSWVFGQFTALVGEEPQTIFTDSDAAMALAINEIWPSTTHLLCIFHLWKNFFEHISGLFKGQQDKWREVANTFWRLAKTSESSLQHTFDSDFNVLVRAVDDVLSQASEKTKNGTHKWLDSLCSRKQSWVACYTWQHCTYGIHSTQRAESMHRVIADFCSKTHTISEIAGHLETMAEKQAMKQEMMCQRNMFTQLIGTGFTDPYFIEDLLATLTLYAQNLVQAQAAQMSQYMCEADDQQTLASLASTAYIVTRMGSPKTNLNMTERNEREQTLRSVDNGLGGYVGSKEYLPHCTTLTTCSCQFPNCFGLPCRHIIRCAFAEISSTNDPSAVVEKVLVSHTLVHAQYHSLLPCNHQHTVNPMWSIGKPVADKRVAIAIGQSSTHHYESLATRHEKLQSMASVAVDLAAVKGAGPSSELKSYLESFIQRHGEQQASDVVAATMANGQQLLANPQLQKNQKQARQQPAVGPTTKTAGRQSREHKAAKKKANKAQEKKKTADFLK
jgi:MULE transposase domain